MKTTKSFLAAVLTLFSVSFAWANNDCDDLNDHVYFHLPMRSLPLISTLPHSTARIPAEPTSNKTPQSGMFSVQTKKISDSRLEIEGIWVFDKFMPLKDAKGVASRALENALREEQAQQGSRLDKGDFLYQAPNHEQWETVLRDGYYTVLMDTRFDQMPATTLADAGVQIRISVPGPFYGNGGTPLAPHFARVDVLDGDRWVTLDGYRIRHGLQF